MYLMFVDDSGSGRGPLPREGLEELVVLGAVIIHEHQVAKYSTQVAELRSRLSIPEDVEYKWNPPKNSFLKEADEQIRVDLARGMLEAAAECDITTIVVACDQGRLGWEKSASEPFLRPWIFERFEYYLTAKEGTGIAVWDEPGGGSKDRARFLVDSRTLMAEGTDYVKSGRILLPFLTAPSEHVALLQLADLVAAATTAALAGRRRGLDLLDLLRPLMRRNSWGLAGGYGLALWPRSPLVGLYYWIAGDTSRHDRPLEPQGLPFASSGNVFAEECGLKHDNSPCDCAEQARGVV